MVDEHSCGLLLLAAGGSRRMGSPKQLLDVGGEPLIRVMGRTALGAGLHPTIVVLGAHAEEIQPHLQDLPLSIVVNPHWSEGMSGSLRLAVTTALACDVRVGGLLVMLADQPWMTTAHLKRVIAAQRVSQHPIVASRYGGHLGPPAYFSRAHFPALQALQGDVGARTLLEDWGAQPVDVPADIAEDVDTPADLERLLDSSSPDRCA